LLALRSITGSPIITATASVVAGFVVVLIANNAAPGNSSTWQLNVLLTHSIQQGRSTGPGSIYVVDASGGTGNASLVVENIAELRLWEGGADPTSLKAVIVKGYYGG
jgi:hypothetical protein